MDIIIYLIELLNTKKEIGINGLGTLYKKKSPGRYDAQTHRFLPPNYSLAFTQEVKEHQNLAIYINTKRNVSLGTANYFISQFVDEVQQSLHSQGEFELSGIGKLLKNETGAIALVPEANINFGFDFFALPAVSNRTSEANADVATLDQILEENALEEENPGHQPYIETVTPDSHVRDFESEATETDEDSKPDLGESLDVREMEAEQDSEVSQKSDLLDLAPTDHVTAVENPEQDQLVTAFPDEKLEQNEPLETLNDDSKLHTANEEDHPVYDEISEITYQQKVYAVAPHPIETITPETSSEEVDNDVVDQISTKKVESPSEYVTANQNSDYSYHAPVTHTTEEETVHRRTGFPLWGKILILLVIIAILGAVVYFVSPNSYRSIFKNEANQDRKLAANTNNNAALQNLTDSLSFADSIMSTAKKVGLEVDKAKDTLKFTVKAESLNKTTYEIIGVAYKTQREVDDYIARMKKRGIAAKAVDKMPGRMTKISLATYNNRDSARKYVDKFKQDLKNPGIYIYVNKNKE